MNQEQEIKELRKDVDRLEQIVKAMDMAYHPCEHQNKTDIENAQESLINDLEELNIKSASVSKRCDGCWELVTLGNVCPLNVRLCKSCCSHDRHV